MTVSIVAAFILLYTYAVFAMNNEVRQERDSPISLHRENNREYEGMFGDKLIGQLEPPIDHGYQILGCLSAGGCCRLIYHAKLLRTRPDQQNVLIRPKFGKHRIVSVTSVPKPPVDIPTYGRFPVAAEFSCADTAQLGPDDPWQVGAHVQGTWWYQCPPGMKIALEYEDHPITIRQNPLAFGLSTTTRKSYCVPADMVQGTHSSMPPRFACFDINSVGGNIVYTFLRKATDQYPGSTKVERNSNRE